MTDFGRRLGLGDMLKSVYDANNDGVIDIIIAHKLSHQLTGSDQISVAGLLGELAAAQPSTWAKVTGKPLTFAPSGHKTSHESGGTDPISVAGLVGATATAILGDATAGRVFRAVVLEIIAGTNANTLKCQTNNRWNGDVLAYQDNIAKDATTGHFHLNAGGTQLTILNTGLTGNAVYAISSLRINSTTIEALVSAIKSTTGIRLSAQGLSDGTGKDLTTLVATGATWTELLYITDA